MLREHFPDQGAEGLSLALALGRASVTVDRLLADRIKAFELTPVALQTLISVLIASDGPIHLSELGKELRVTKANVSWVLTRLEKQGLITRNTDPADGRRIRASLTKRGRETLEELVPLALETLDEAFAGLNARDRTQLKQITSRVGG